VVWLVGAFLLFTAALLSKAVAVSLPVVLLILDVYPLGRLGVGPGRWFGPAARRVWLEKVPFLAVSLIFMGLAVVGRIKDHHMVSVENWGLVPRIAQACYGIWFYVVKTVLPWNITAYYPMPEQVVLWDPPFLASLLATVGLSVGLFLLRRRWPGLLAVWLCYLVILAPNLGLVRISGQIAADRYSYMAMLGGVALLAAGLGRLWRVCRRGWPAAAVLTASSAGVLLGLIMLSRAQCQTWRSSEALWAHALSHGAGQLAKIHDNLGAALFDQGRYKEAGAQFAEAIRLDSNYAGAHNNLGAVLKRQGRLEEAIAQFAETIRLTPDDALAHNNLGMALDAQGRHEEAMAEYAEALRIKPGLADVHNALGAVLDRQGRLEEAKAKFAEAIRLNPNYAEAYNNLGLALFRQGRIEEAMTKYAEALRLNPHLAEAHNSRGSVLYQQGQLEEARAEYARAIELDPNHADAHSNLGSVLFGQGRLAQARAEYAEAIRLDPKHVDARSNLAAVLLSQGRLEDAAVQYTEVLRLDPNHADAHINLGSIRYHQGRFEEALAQYAEAARLAPENAGVHNNRARIWATAPEAKCRDGRRAVEAATRACELSGWKDAGCLDTLAAACAEAGDFATAVKWQSRAIDLVTDEKTKAAFRGRLELYQQRQPYHEAIKGR
jgi:Flp pilus assembly protein TadD